MNKSGSLLAWIWRQATVTPDALFEDLRSSKEHKKFTTHHRLLRKLTSTNLFEHSVWNEQLAICTLKSSVVETSLDLEIIL